MGYTSFIDKLNPLTSQHLESLFDESAALDKGEFAGYEDAWYEEIAFKIAGSGRSGIDFLLSRMTITDEVRLRAILTALSSAGEQTERVHQVLRTYLDDPHPMVVSATIDTARHLGYEDYLGAILPLQHHTSPYVVGSVLRYLRQHYPMLAKPLLLEALESKDPIIVQNGIDELDELNATEALPRIRHLLSHEDANVKQAAQAAISNLEKSSEPK